jgi:hypothetical protein
MIFLDQIEDRHPPFLFDISVATQYGRFVKIDGNDTRVCHDFPLTDATAGARAVR